MSPQPVLCLRLRLAAERRHGPTPQAAISAGGDPGHTASVRRPVPPADVGGGAQRKQTSILDIILGN